MFNKLVGSFFALLIFCAPALACSVDLNPTSSQLSSAYPAVDEFIEKQMLEAGIPGVALAVVQNGQIIYLNGFGFTSHHFMGAGVGVRGTVYGTAIFKNQELESSYLHL